MSTVHSPQVGVHWDPRYEAHDPGPGHPESAQRYRVLAEALAAFPEPILRLPGRCATDKEICLAHTPKYLREVREDVESYADSLRTGDTAICAHSLDVAMHASGAVLAAVDAVMSGQVSKAFCAIRPPGHHASASRGMGFCIFNHVAIAAKYLLKHHRLHRIAIVDWDVHHGNGTEEIFISDPAVFYLSLHQWGIYPFTGDPEHRGRGAGLGYNLNLPLPAHSTGETALQLWDSQAAPALRAFRPEFILISAGFDARVGDPLGGLLWSDDTFAALTTRCTALADEFSHDRLVSLLEGGYAPEGLSSSVTAHLRALASTPINHK